MNTECKQPSSFQASIPIAGAGCISAAGKNLSDNLVSMLRAERNPVTAPLIVPAHPVSCPLFAVPDQWLKSAVEQIPQPEERCLILALTAALEALTASGLATPEVRSSMRIGICLGTVVGAALEEESFYRQYHSGGCPEPEPVTRFLANPPAGRLRRLLGLSGPCMTVTTACTSGAAAVAQAAEWIRNGVCDAVLAGGTEKISRLSLNGFSSLMIADRSLCRPFDRERAGMNLGEGAGMLLLESSASVARRQVDPCGWLLGWGNAFDAYHLSRPEPNGDGLRKAVNTALFRAGIGKDEIAFINAHGTGTPDNDRVEGAIFRQDFPRTPFLSTKYYTGHTLGAAGAVEAALTLACLNQGIIPGTPEFSGPDPEIGNLPNLHNRCLGKFIALSTSLAYGGHNLALVIAGAAARPVKDQSSESAVFPLPPTGTEPRAGSDIVPKTCENSALPATSRSFSREPAGVEREPLLIRGIGTAGGFGHGAENLWQALRAPPRPRQTIRIRTPAGEIKKPAFLCDTSPLADFVPKKKLRRVDHFSRMTTLGIVLALKHAGLYDYDRQRIGVILSTGLGSNQSTFRFINSYLDDGDAGASPLLFSASGNSGALANASILLGLTGPALTVCQPEMASSVGLMTAANWLHSRIADTVIVGAVEEYLPLRGYVLEKLGILSDHQDMHPFEFHRSTATAGEGTAFLALTLAEDVCSRPPMAEIRTSCRGKEAEIPSLPERQPILIGADGNRCRAAPYAELIKARPAVDWRSFTPFFGSLPGSLPVHVAIAALALDRGEELPAPANSFPARPGHPNSPAGISETIHCLEAAKSGEYGLFSLFNFDNSVVQ